MKIVARDVKRALFYLLPPIFRLGQTTLLARIAGPELMGIVLATMILPATLPRLLDVGMPHAAGYHLRRDRRSIGLIWSVGARVIAAAALLTIGIVLLLPYIPFGDERVGHLLQLLAIPVFIFIIAQLARDVALAQLVALEHEGIYFVASVFPVLSGLAGLLLMTYWSITITPERVLLLLMGTEVAGAVIALGAIAAAAAAESERFSSSRGSRELLGYGIRAYPGGAAKILLTRADRIILATVLPAHLYAIYALSLSFRDAALLPTNAIGLVLLNKFTALHKAAASIWPTVRLGLAVALSLTGSIFLLFALVGPWAVPTLLGVGFGEAVPFMTTAVASSIFLALSGVFWTLFLSIGRPGLMSYANILSAASGILLIAPAAVLWGIWGAVAGVLVSSFATFLVSAHIAWQHGNVPAANQ